jgi:hypothetical protein
MPAPFVNQGTLSRLSASVSWPAFPSLNVTPSFLNREGIRLAFEGEATKNLPTMTGLVTSPEPFQVVNMTINLLKTQGLSAAYELQRQTLSLLGDGVVRPDVNSGGVLSTVAGAITGGLTGGGIGPYALFNCSILNVRELSFAGEDAGYSVTIGGYILINQALFL